MQPTIWKKSRFIELYKQVQAEKWFESDTYEEACRSLNIKGFFTYNGEKKRGGHFDSSVYPYIATAVVKGKWNVSEYQQELQKQLQSYEEQKEKLDKEVEPFEIEMSASSTY